MGAPQYKTEEMHCGITASTGQQAPLQPDSGRYKWVCRTDVHTEQAEISTKSPQRPAGSPKEATLPQQRELQRVWWAR